jgi:hypothetical protein
MARKKSAALVQPAAQTVSVPPPRSIRFWRIQDSVARTSKSLTLDGGTLVITFE